MLGYAEFVVAALALLLVPGPTNALLATGGALHGARSASSLVVAALLGYSAAIAILLVAVAPLADSVDGVRLALQLACAAYLAFVAYKLWRFKAGAQTSAVSFRQVFWATLSNPKAMVFAFVLLPGSTGEPRFAAYAISLLGLMAVSGAVWVLAGTGVSRAAGGASDGIIRRVSSVVMASFSAIMIVGALGLR